MEKETKKFCPLLSQLQTCDNGCAWYNIQTTECSVLTISKELSCIELDLDNINRKPN